MKINIGNNLKKLRLTKGITQEQLAEAFGVSAQAISRWENNTAYPDITLLPGLAMYYDTSVDAIVGMDEIKKSETIRMIHVKINEHVLAGQVEDAVLLIRDSLKIYPNDSGLLMSLEETLAHQSHNEAARAEAIAIAERILKNNDVSIKAKATTTANLIFLYLRSGKLEQASKLVGTLPHIWESREVMMPEVYDGSAYANELKSAILKALVFFCIQIDSIPTRKLGVTPEYIQLGVNFTPTKTVVEMLAQIQQFLQA